MSQSLDLQENSELKKVSLCVMRSTTCSSFGWRCTRQSGEGNNWHSSSTHTCFVKMVVRTASLCRVWREWTFPSFIHGLLYLPFYVMISRHQFPTNLHEHVYVPHCCVLSGTIFSSENNLLTFWLNAPIVIRAKVKRKRVKSRQWRVDSDGTEWQRQRNKDKGYETRTKTIYSDSTPFTVIVLNEDTGYETRTKTIDSDGTERGHRRWNKDKNSR